MPISPEQKQEIKTLLANKLRSKLKDYGRETSYMPFLARLIQDNEKIAAYSFIHSLSTSLGMSVFEEVSVILARPHVDEAERNYKIGGTISSAQKSVIADIITGLRNGTRQANLTQEIAEILQASSEGGKPQKEGNIADFYMRRGEQEYFFEIKTVKPNIDVFNKSKTKLLEWVARRNKAINVYLAFPYNPYHPKPYDRFTESGMMNHPHDFLIGEEYWNFIGGENCFNQLLPIFNEIGEEYKTKIEQKFKEVAAKHGDSF